MGFHFPKTVFFWMPMFSAILLGCTSRHDYAPVVRTNNPILNIDTPVMPQGSAIRDGRRPNSESAPQKKARASNLYPPPGIKRSQAVREIPRRAENHYVVSPGDTLYSIGVSTGRGYRNLAKWNRIEPPYQIEVGQILKLFDSNKAVAAEAEKKVNRATAVKAAAVKPKTSIPSIHTGGGALKQPGKHKASGYNKSSSKKKSIISIDNRNNLMLNFRWPLMGKIKKNFIQTSRKGIDISGNAGQTVRAAESGKVVYSGQGLIGYGNLLIIKHNDEYLTAYANNSGLLAKEGEYVKKGQGIAKIGLSDSDKAILHFEIRKNGKSVNPLTLLPKYE